LNIHDHTHQVISKVDVETPLFQPFPPELGFHHYEPNKTYEQILWFRNNDYVPRRIKIEPPRGGTFSVKRMRGKRGEKLSEEPEDAGKKSGPTRNGRPTSDPSVGKVAPGMEVAFKVRFVPVDTEDYRCDLVVATERERFVVPIKCVGNKPALDFPDLVAFESTPAKCSSVATRVVRNVGTKRASFAFLVPDPFAAFPSEGVLDVGEAVQIRLEFHPERCGTYEAEMEIDCGEGVAPAVVGLIGDGCEMRVGLDCGEVEMLPTFVRKRTRRTFRVVNRGDRVARFEVKRLADAFLDEEARLRATRAFAAGDPTSDGETLGDARPALHLRDDDASSSSSYDSADEDDILGAEAVAFATRRKGLDRALGADALLFEHAAFSVSPLRGEVQPGCEFEVTVTFHPDDAGETFATCFVDVEGREDRLPLAFRGQAVGPLAVFNYDALEVGDVFVGAVHQYEVELVNRGEIECAFEYVPSDDASRDASTAGRVFSFEPARGALGVGQSRTITVTLCSETLGSFDETFEFFVEGGERNAYLDFRGKVVGSEVCVRGRRRVKRVGFRNRRAGVQDDEIVSRSKTRARFPCGSRCACRARTRPTRSSRCSPARARSCPSASSASRRSSCRVRSGGTSSRFCWTYPASATRWLVCPSARRAEWRS
jgi:hydrocephalus-inducing protein